MQTMRVVFVDNYLDIIDLLNLYFVHAVIGYVFAYYDAICFDIRRMK